jgi:arginine decarboxylase
LMPKLIEMAAQARAHINQIPGLQSLGKPYFVEHGAFDYDQTKLIVKVSDLGMTGFDIYNELRDSYNIQLELAETHLILAVLSIGTEQKDLDALIEALKKISQKYTPMQLQPIIPKIKYIHPESFTRPRSAYHAPKKYVRLDEAVDEVAAESVMIYPPGIPIVIPGEIITQDMIDDFAFYKEQGSTILSDTESGFIKVVDKEQWIKWEHYNENEES